MVVSTDLMAQKGFLNQLDTNRIENTYANDSSVLKDMINSPLWNEKFLPLDYDQDFLNAAVCGYINYQRERRAKKPLQYSEELYSVCFHFLDYFSLQSFQYDTDKNARYNKLANKSAKKIQYPKGIIKTAIFRLPAVDFKGGAFYFDDEEESSELKLFYGIKPSKKELGSDDPPKRKEVEGFLYSDFIKNFFRHYLSTRLNSLIYSKDYTSMACYLMVDKKTINTQRIPQISCMIIFGANRLERSITVSAKKNQKKLIN